MKEQDKQLLFKDLCARLPYGVKINIRNNYTYTMEDIEFTPYHIVPVSYEIEYLGLRPYLRSMSSMTEEEENEFNHVFELELAALEESAVGHTIKSAASNAFVIDFYNRHHFDYRGLIPMGLALEAPEGMYKTI